MTREQIVPVPVQDEMKDAYLNYAMSVIVSRALPDVRDGLKPSQRRILYAMYDLNLTPGAKPRKCAKICGDTSGNFHPHGEQVIYPTLVRLAQDFVMRYPLIQGQGNFGSNDGDEPAAMRYTEARLTAFAMMMLEDLDKETVDFAPNYDETREEPRLLPGKFPNLICNGTTGIAVGMATSIPPHNLTEICDAAVHLIEHPDATLDDLMKIVPGPDFPTGAIIHGKKGIHDAYRNGKGQIRMRAKTHFEGKSIVVSEIPYNTIRKEIIEQIADLVKENKIQGISDIRDESDREGTRIVIELNKGEDENFILNQLMANTRLDETFSIIMIALVNQRPKLLNLKELLQAYIDHRKVIIRRRTEYLLKKARAQAHILEGLLKALDLLDEIIALIRASESEPAARDALVARFGFSVEQAEAILKMTLGRLTRLEKDKLFAELQEILDRIAEYTAILADERMVLDIIREDLYEMREKHGDPRRSQIIDEEVKEIAAEELIREEDILITFTEQGYAKRVPLESYRVSGKGVVGADVAENDAVRALLHATTTDTILFFTSTGYVHAVKGHHIPGFEKSARGKAFSTFLNLDNNERVTCAARGAEKGFLVLATAKGSIKKSDLGEYGKISRGGIVALKLEKDDAVVAAGVSDGNHEIILATEKGMSIRFGEEDLRPMGRSAYGTGAMKLEEGDRVVDMALVRKGMTLLTLCALGSARRTDLEEYRLQSRAGVGIINVNVTPRSGNVVGIEPVKDKDECVAITRQGTCFRLRVRDIEPMNRGSQGRKLVDLEKDETFAALIRVPGE